MSFLRPVFSQYCYKQYRVRDWRRFQAYGQWAGVQARLSRAIKAYGCPQSTGTQHLRGKNYSLHPVPCKRDGGIVKFLFLKYLLKILFLAKGKEIAFDQEYSSYLCF